jgi:hypothetical protein
MCSLLAKPGLTDHPVDVGQRSEGAVLARLVDKGYRILLPFGVNQRYDLVIDNDGELLKAQVKTGRLRDGVVEFRAVSVQCNRNRTRREHYTGEVDLFIVYCPQNRGVYVIPAEDVPPSGMFLRVAAPRNNQSKRVRWASDYELPA